MRNFAGSVVLAFVVAITFSVPSASWAQGKGGGGSGGGTAQAAGALYGDLYVIERDGNGEPWLKTIDAAGGPYVCQQPLRADCGFLPLNGEKLDFDPEVEDACAVQSSPIDYTGGLQAVSFGRESVSRAPATVIDKSYGEALKGINSAVPASMRKTATGNVDRCTNVGGTDSRAIKLDPAGRITLCLASENDPFNVTDPPTYTYAWKAIDAPLENLGLYRAAMTNGCFGPVTDEIVGEEGVRITVTIQLGQETGEAYLKASSLGHLVCDGALPNPVTKSDMLSAAVFVAAGADKESPVTLDEIVNLNNYLGVNTWTYTTVRKVKTLTVDYFDFKVSGGPGGWFGYTKGVDACVVSAADNTVTLLTTPNGGVNFEPRDVSVFGASPPGVDLENAAVTVCRAGAPLNAVCDDAGGANPVYGIAGTGIYGCGGANWFTQAAEDARKSIWYLHNWRLPVVGY